MAVPSTAAPWPASTGGPPLPADARAGAAAEPGRDRLVLTPTVLVAMLTLVLLGSRQFLWSGLTVGYAAAAFLTPVWLPSLRRFWGGRWLLGLVLVAVPMGAWLTWMAAADHRTGTGLLLSTSILVGGLVAGVGIILWARELMPVRWVALSFAVGYTISEVLGMGRFSSNPWKFAWAVPTALLLLSVLMTQHRRILEVLTLLALGGISALQDSRSLFAMFFLAAVLVAWQSRPRGTRRRTTAGVIALGLGLGLGLYQAGTSLMLDGHLGESTQARSVEQVQASGSILLGGRPEIAASAALIERYPLGMGSGTRANLDDILAAKSGMAAIGYDPNNGYVERYLFGNELKLHSVTAELWLWFGIPGLAFAVTFAVLIVRGLSHRLARGTASGALAYLACASLWNLAFSPTYGSAPILMLTLGLAMLPRAGHGEHQLPWVDWTRRTVPTPQVSRGAVVGGH